MRESPHTTRPVVFVVGHPPAVLTLDLLRRRLVAPEDHLAAMAIEGGRDWRCANRLRALRRGEPVCP